MRLLSKSSAPALLGLALCAWPARARADSAPTIEPAAPHALGRVLTAGPAPTGPTLLASGGYGYTGAVLGLGDAHHRVAGALTLDERPLPWLDFALRFDGRYDAHVIPGQPTDTGLVGDPRLYARVDRAGPGGLRLGARAGLWLPGRNAPSVDWGSLSPELLGMASFVAPAAPIAVTVNVGYRVDRSAHSAPDAARLSAGDRLALELGAFDQLLTGVALTVGRGPAQAFFEASADLLVGSNAPAAKTSPMLIGAGGRFALGPSLQLEAELEVSPSSRPAVVATSPLIPVPPRFAAWLGLAYRVGAAPEPAKPVVSEPAAPAKAPPPAPPPAPRSVKLVGRVTSSDGGKLADLRVEVQSGEGPQQPVTVEEDGDFRLVGKPGEVLTVSAEASGYLPARTTTSLAEGTPNHLELTLERRPARGQIRGLVRSLRGKAVAAEIAVEPESGPSTDGATPEAQHLKAEAGRFQLDVAPGRYRVTIAASGFETQKRKVDVEENGVTLLNVDLRAAK